MMWFEQLTGFAETSPKKVRESFMLDGQTIKSRVNGRTMNCGELEMPSLGELRDCIQGHKVGKISVKEIVANVQHLHTDATNAGALFQAASQFNLLEMISPDYTPEDGIGIYENDRTQGPACAIACGAGTIYRNYFINVNGDVGQSADNQIDCLADIGVALNNADNRLWEMTNGYAFPSESGLTEISNSLKASDETALDELRQLLRIGIQWGTEVTLDDCQHTVSQIYCSAVPVRYSHLDTDLWAEFAQLILEASYEATICAAIINSTKNGNNKLFLTTLGGGAFGNRAEWIIRAMDRALNLYQHADLDIAIVSYGSSNSDIRKIINRY